MNKCCPHICAQEIDVDEYLGNEPQKENFKDLSKARKSNYNLKEERNKWCENAGIKHLFK